MICYHATLLSAIYIIDHPYSHQWLSAPQSHWWRLLSSLLGRWRRSRRGCWWWAASLRINKEMLRFSLPVWMFLVTNQFVSIYRAAQVSSGTESDRRCGNLSHSLAGRWHETFPADLSRHLNNVRWWTSSSTDKMKSVDKKAYLHVSISAEASFPLAAKWIRMNFP